MKIIITKKQYKFLVYSLIDTVTGGELTLVMDDSNTLSYHRIFDSYGEEIMSIFYKKGSGRNPGCKNDLGLDSVFVEELQKYVPHFRRKIFSEVMVDYVFEKTGIKCDCIDYTYTVPAEGKEFDDDVRFMYNVKKKKRINFNESVDDRQSLDKIIYDFLKDEYYPDYNWGPELFDFYREDVEKYGFISFYINDNEEYTYYNDGTLEIMRNTSERLDSWFNDSWKPVFKKWFEEHSGLKVKRIVTMDGVTALNESVNIDKNKKLINSIIGFDFSNKIQQITSWSDVPTSFDGCVGWESVRRWLNYFGPMYKFEYYGVEYLYQDRGDFEVFIDDDCYEFVDNEIPEKFGIAVLGLRFSDIIDMYFTEEN
jgi:hypothetical protein